MYSKVKIGGHPVHPMLIGFPITFYILTFVGFVVYQTGNQDIFWYKLGYFSNFAAVTMAVIAAVPGFIDWFFGIPKNVVAKKRGLIHMSLNLTTLALYIVSAFLIYGTWDTPENVSLGPVMGITAVGSLILIGAAYFGWQMISQDKVGVNLTAEQENLQQRYEHQERPQPPTFH